MGKKFTKKVEDFVCEICGVEVVGTGYTDHCPNCLWGKHVDIYPGDQKANCGGLMKPVEVEKAHGEWNIKYHCTKCGYEHQNKASVEDSMEKNYRIKQSLKSWVFQFDFFSAIPVG